MATEDQKRRVLAFCYKVATSPYLESEGLTNSALKKGDALMMYLIDPEKNISKFYEVLIRHDSTSSSYSLLKKWGRLTDRLSGSRVDGSEKHGLTYEEAKTELQKVEKDKKRKGYISAWGPDHKNPANGNKLVDGDYPIGLTGKSFGWGSQEISDKVSDIKKLKKDVEKVIRRTKSKERVNKQDVIEILSATREFLDELKTSSAATKIKKKIDRVVRRMKGDSRFSPDPNDENLIRDMVEVKNYLEHQLAYHK
jgi:predicted DNA-binding WGR domain protein